LDLGTNFACNTNEGVCVDKPMITVDQNSGSPHFGRVFVSWSEFRSNVGPGDLVLFGAFTDNGGSSWTGSTSSLNVTNDCGNGSSPAFNANGDVLVVWEEKNSLCGQAGGPEIRSQLSTDGGHTWPAGDVTVTAIND